MTQQKEYTLNMTVPVWLTIIFIVLKLAGAIDWAWYWVFSPILIPLVVGITILAIGFVLVSIGDEMSRRARRKRRLAQRRR